MNVGLVIAGLFGLGVAVWGWRGWRVVARASWDLAAREAALKDERERRAA